MHGGKFHHPLTPVMREQGMDFDSARVQEVAGPALDQPNFTVLRFERSLRKQLLARYLRRPRPTPPPELAARDSLRPELHGSSPASTVPTRDYYDEELRDLVGEKTGWLCERFGYRFE